MNFQMKHEIRDWDVDYSELCERILARETLILPITSVFL